MKLNEILKLPINDFQQIVDASEDDYDKKIALIGTYLYNYFLNLHVSAGNAEVDYVERRINSLKKSGFFNSNPEVYKEQISIIRKNCYNTALQKLEELSGTPNCNHFEYLRGKILNTYAEYTCSKDKELIAECRTRCVNKALDLNLKYFYENIKALMMPCNISAKNSLILQWHGLAEVLKTNEVKGLDAEKVKTFLKAYNNFKAVIQINGF